MRSSSLKKATEITNQYGIANGKLLGRGGFGSVYMCKNFVSNQMCALKIVRKQTMCQTKEMMRLMEQELNVLKIADHPNIVNLYDLLEDDTNFYVVSELMRGGDLSNFMDTHDRLTERQAASVIKQTLQAINYMHQQNFLHRDLKPENILLQDTTHPLHVKIADFGLATQFQEG